MLDNIAAEYHLRYNEKENEDVRATVTSHGPFDAVAQKRYALVRGVLDDILDAPLRTKGDGNEVDGSAVGKAVQRDRRTVRDVAVPFIILYHNFIVNGIQCHNRSAVAPGQDLHEVEEIFCRLSLGRETVKSTTLSRINCTRI